MLYYSTNHLSSKVSFKDAISHTEAPDGGLYMPEKLPLLPKAFINNIHGMSASDLLYVATNMFLADDMPSAILRDIAQNVISAPLPVYEIEPGIFVMELFHGPTMTVKDIGARFLASMLHTLHCTDISQLNVLISTNGNSGNAIANAFHKNPGVNVFVLYPKGLSRAQFDQINSYGDNIHAIEVNGHLDNCTTMINRAYLDPDLNQSLSLTSANSYNFGYVLPYIAVYFYAAAQMISKGCNPSDMFMSIPTGSCGNLMAALMAKKMGMPVGGIISACNANAGFVKCLERGIECVREHTNRTLAYAMDIPRSANMPRLLDLCDGDLSALRNEVKADVCTDQEIARTINEVYERCGYLLDPHAAVSYRCLKKQLPDGAKGIFFATAHPSRSIQVLQKVNNGQLKLPPQIKRPNFCSRAEVTIPPTYTALKKYLKYAAIAAKMVDRV